MIGYLTLEYRLRKLEKVVAGKMPKYFYHGTTVDAIDSILKNGLKPANLLSRVVWPNLTNKNKVYLTGNIDFAKRWSVLATEIVNVDNAKSIKENPYYSDNSLVVIRVNSKYLDPDLLEADHNTYYGKVATDLDFINNKGYLDYEYNGVIPPKALDLVWF